ncbi:hypothetical protein EJ04DRAFT_249542 [Polyplosphaeria fusca]|uniref:Uncharacterized protein n=1 Tax=Polyplosphaeria fusca TaxID=682080 RepID=A0A9P4QZQ8_9PLEO|nr:hypothetical protein EJ04DRAFT_249542 [Polyplosphaeria fusca]
MAPEAIPSLASRTCSCCTVLFTGSGCVSRHPVHSCRPLDETETFFRPSRRTKVLGRAARQGRGVDKPGRWL